MLMDDLKGTAKGTAKGSFLAFLGAAIAYFAIKAWQKVKK